jgi:hypothetical protein
MVLVKTGSSVFSSLAHGKLTKRHHELDAVALANLQEKSRQVTDGYIGDKSARAY